MPGRTGCSAAAAPTGSCGGAGRDRLVGEAGADLLAGGAGHDVFVFVAGDTPGPGAPTSSRTSTAGDLLDFRPRSTGPLRWLGTDAFSGAAGELRWEASGAGARVEGDLDGDGRADLAILLDDFEGALGRPSPALTLTRSSAPAPRRAPRC